MKKFLIIVLCIISVAVTANFVLAKKSKTTKVPVKKVKQTPKPSPSTSTFHWPWEKACTGKGPIMLGTSPVDPNEIAMVSPMGQMVGGHVTPIDHGYIYAKEGYKPNPVPVAVRAPANGVITAVTRTVRNENGKIFDDYQMNIEYTCTFSNRFSNMTSLSKLVLDKVGNLTNNQSVNPKMTVQEGDVIGYITWASLDVWLINDEVTLKGFLVPDHYNESWKFHVVDLFDNMKEPARSQLLALNPRTALPRWGKIDYDIDGKLIGNWFVEGTNGYRGTTKNIGYEGYWKGHLAIVPNAIDPSGIEISLGDYNGEAMQFGVKGNSPDPANVSVDSGIIKYELVPLSFVDGTGGTWYNRYYASGVKMKNQDDLVQGTVLIQMIGNRRMKMEIFPGQTGDQVSGFTSAAVIYER